MMLELNKDVARLAEFMQSNFELSRLSPLAEAIYILAPALWGKRGGEPITPIGFLSTISPVEQGPTASSQ
jgi:hypothetical protein